jgi:sulfhydrogenase subunit beta (sulfur reductase)
MRARVVNREDVLKIVDVLRKEYEVIAPFFRSGRDTCFDTVTDENREQIQIHLPNPYYPPKRYVLPHIQRLMTIRTNGSVVIEPEYEEPKRAVFGIRSCDVAGIGHLDRIFLGGAFRDIYYSKLRKHLFLVNVVCTDAEQDIDDDCFCVCADTGPAVREGFDLQLIDLGEEFLVLAGSSKGEALFDQPFFKKASPAHVERRRELLNQTRKKFKKANSWYSAAVRFVSLGKVSEETWEEVGNRCLECGGCTYVCPTCNCFTVTDRTIEEGETERLRLWDSCALSGFTRMAGGHNPRKAVHDRRNRRFFRKLAHYYMQRELSVACVGCGRCVNVCHGDVGMPSVVEILRRASAEGDQHV